MENLNMLTKHFMLENGKYQMEKEVQKKLNMEKEKLFSQVSSLLLDLWLVAKNMKENGLMTLCMAKEPINILQEMFTTETGLKGQCRDKEKWFMLMDLHMMENGITI